ncbi:hypothetical protein Esti_002101 [Eimeria stiedai]
MLLLLLLLRGQQQQQLQREQQQEQTTISKSRWVVGEAEWTSKKRQGEPWELQAFTEALQEAVAGCWGSLGAACLLPSVRLVHLNRHSGVYLLQAPRSCIRELLVALMAVASVQGRGCRLHVLHVSGTLLKAKERLEALLHAAVSSAVSSIEAVGDIEKS